MTELLDQKELGEFLGVSKFIIWQLQKKEDFPKPVKIMSKKKWKKSEIEEYLEKTREKA